MFVDRDEQEGDREISEEELIWAPNTYEGGKPGRQGIENDSFAEAALQEWLDEPDKSTPFRLLIVSVVTTSKTNSTAVDIVKQVYEYIKNATDHDVRIGYQIMCGNRRKGKVMRLFSNS